MWHTIPSVCSQCCVLYITRYLHCTTLYLDFTVLPLFRYTIYCTNCQHTLFVQAFPVFLEFLQHHLLLGVSHIFLTISFTWDGKHLPKYLRILRSFIEEGTVSITSHADNELEHIYNVKKLAISRDTIKTFQVRSMLYLCCWS
jgi:hypothetical protein